MPDEGFVIAVKERNEDRSWSTVYETYDWPDATKRWYDNWRKSAISQTFNDSDWDFLLETAVLHACFWMGDKTVAAEMRLRVSKFGATPEDRLRLRISVDKQPTAGMGDEPPAPAPKSRQKYGDLRIVS